MYYCTTYTSTFVLRSEYLKPKFRGQIHVLAINQILELYEYSLKPNMYIFLVFIMCFSSSCISHFKFCYPMHFCQLLCVHYELALVCPDHVKVTSPTHGIICSSQLLCLMKPNSFCIMCKRQMYSYRRICTLFSLKFA